MLLSPGTAERIGTATHAPVPSIRLKLIRLGVQDHEWLKAVRQASGAPGSVQPSRALRRYSPGGTPISRRKARLKANSDS
ncbi:hypothetical protein HMI51_21395 [Corallococcus coralloides]|nr:hypothetical protein [Corallococcus coralloides]